MDEAATTEIASSSEKAPPSSSGSETNDISTDFFGAFQDLMQGEINEGTSGLILKVVIPAAAALLAIIVTYFVAKMISRWVANAMCTRVDQTLGRFAGKFTFYTIFTVVGLAILQAVNVPITSFAAIMAATGFAIGLAFQGTLSNFASGILLLVFRPFKVGDVVNAAGVMGKINEIDLFTTTFDTPDNRRLVVPNSQIAGATIENVSYHEHRRVDVPVGVAYGASLESTREVLTRAAEALSEKTVEGEGRGYQIVLTNLGASSVDWTVRLWAESADFFAVKEALTAEVKRQLDDAGIDIPFPQMQLHIADSDAPDTASTHQVTQAPVSNESDNRNGRIRPRIRGESSGT